MEETKKLSKNEIIVPEKTIAGDFFDLVRLLKEGAKEVYKNLNGTQPTELFDIYSHPSLYKRANTNQHFYEAVGISEIDRIIEKKYINKWFQDDTMPDNILRMEGVKYGIDLGLSKNIVEYSFGFESRIKYYFNKKTNEIFCKLFKEPISIELLKAILDDYDTKRKIEIFNLD